MPREPHRFCLGILLDYVLLVSLPGPPLLLSITLVKKKESVVITSFVLSEIPYTPELNGNNTNASPISLDTGCFMEKLFIM